MTIQNSSTKKFSWSKLFKGNVFLASLVTIITGFIGSVLYKMYVDREFKTSVLTGYVYEIKRGDTLTLVNARITLLNNDKIFSKNNFEARTLSTGRFDGTITGRGKDLVTMLITNKDNQTSPCRIEIDFKRDTNQLHSVIVVFDQSNESSTTARNNHKSNKTESKRQQIEDESIIKGSRQISSSKDTSLEIINTKENSDVAVMAMRNGKFDNSLTSSFAKWIQSASHSRIILRNKLIEEANIQKIIDGSTFIVQDIPSLQSSRVVCLIRCSTEYSKSEIDESLVVANITCEMVFVETTLGKVIESFEHSERASGTSREMAINRAEEDLLNFFKTKTLNF